MRSYTVTAYKDFWEGANERYSPAELNELLGSADQLVLHWRASKVGGTTPTVTVTLYGSNNGADWINRETLVSGASLTAGQLNTGLAVSATRPMAYCRLGVSMAGSGGPSADLEVLVCGRDSAS